MLASNTPNKTIFQKYIKTYVLREEFIKFSFCKSTEVDYKFRTQNELSYKRYGIQIWHAHEPGSVVHSLSNCYPKVQPFCFEPLRTNLELIHRKIYVSKYYHQNKIETK